MGRFRFRLQSVQDLRRHAEKQQQNILLQEQRRLDELTAEASRLTEQFSTWARRYVESSASGLPAEEIVRFGSYLEEITRSVRRNAAQTAQQQAVVERERLRLVERMRDRRTVDMLRDKKYAEYRQEESRRAGKTLEDWMTSRL